MPERVIETSDMSTVKTVPRVQPAGTKDAAHIDP